MTLSDEYYFDVSFSNLFLRIHRSIWAPGGLEALDRLMDARAEIAAANEAMMDSAPGYYLLTGFDSETGKATFFRL